MAKKQKEAAASIKDALAEMSAPDQDKEILSESNSGVFLRKLEFSQLKFDYDQVEEAYRDKIKDAAVDINQRRRRTVEDVIAIGQRLSEVKGIMGNQFEQWCETEFDYSYNSAMQYINIYKRFGADPAQLMGYGVSIAGLLASPSASDQAVGYVLDQAAAGDPLSFAEAKAVVDEFSPEEDRRRRERMPRVVQGEYSVEEQEPANTPEEVVKTLLEAPDNTALLPTAIQRASLEELQLAVEQLPPDDTARRPVLEHAIQHYERVHLDRDEAPAIPMRKKLTGKMSIELPRKTWGKLADALEAFDLSPVISNEESSALLALIRKNL